MASRQSSTLRSRGAYLALETSSSVTTLVDFSGRVMEFSIQNSKQQSDDTTLNDTDKVSTNQLNDRTVSVTFDATANNLSWIYDVDGDDDHEPLFEWGAQGNTAGNKKVKGQLSLISFSEGAAVGQAQTLTAEFQIHDYDASTNF